MRLFAAVYPPASAVDHLVTFVSALRVGVASAAGVNTRLARPDTVHVTVAFLGDVADERLDAVTEALGRAVDGPAPSVRLAGGGRFGRGKFTVLWTGLDGDVDALRGLAGAARRSLKKARLPYDDRPWKPHLTIARPGDRLDRADRRRRPGRARRLSRPDLAGAARWCWCAATSAPSRRTTGSPPGRCPEPSAATRPTPPGRATAADRREQLVQLGRASRRTA